MPTVCGVDPGEPGGDDAGMSCGVVVTFGLTIMFNHISSNRPGVLETLRILHIAGQGEVSCLGRSRPRSCGQSGTMFLYQLVPALRDGLTTHPVQTLLVASLSLFFSYIVLNEFVRYHARVPGMKGPPGLPLIGNLWSIRSNAAAKYYEWSKKYGDVYQVQLGNVPVVVVNSAKATKQLWVGQSQALSSRPITYTFHKVRCDERREIYVWVWPDLEHKTDPLADCQCIGRIKHRRPDNWNLALRRLPQAQEEGRRSCRQPARHRELRAIPG